jgi:hypothetical protein
MWYIQRPLVAYWDEYSIWASYVVLPQPVPLDFVAVLGYN